jgi:hypothetical protein
MDIKEISNSNNISEDFAKTITNVVTILNSNGIEHRIIGGLAVGVHSQPRTTQDVDFYIKHEDLDKIKNLFPDWKELDILPHWSGVTAKIDDIDIDFLYSKKNILMQEPAKISNNLNFLGLVELIYTKVLGGRLKDFSDIESLVKHYSGDIDKLEQEVVLKVKNNISKKYQEEVIENLEGAFLIGKASKNSKKSAQISMLLKKISSKYKG